MPNHILTKLKFEGPRKDLARLFRFVHATKKQLGGEREFSFERIIPYPKRKRKANPVFIMDEKGWTGIQHLKRRPWLNWKEAAIALWGTKWDAYDIEWTGKRAVEYNTAWNFALKPLLRLSQLFPAVRIHYQYADEDFGYNFGEGDIKNGSHTEIVTDRLVPGSEEARKWAIEFHGYDYEQIKKEEAEED